MIKNLFLVVIIVLLTSSPQAFKLTSTSFFVCFQKTVQDVKARTVRIHRFPNEIKCVVIYSVNGKDQLISQGGWLSFCEKKANQLVAELQKQNLWKCEGQQNQVEIFYSFSSPKEENKTQAPL